MIFWRGWQILLLASVLLTIRTSVYGADLDVSDLVAGIKQSLEEAQKTAKPPFINMMWVEGEISYVVKKEGEGGFKLYVVTAEGKYATEAVQRVKFRLEPPSGKPWKVELPGEIKSATIAGVDVAAKKVFIVGPNEWSAIPLTVHQNTILIDAKGVTKTFSYIQSGTQANIKYSAGRGGEPTADVIAVAPPPRK